MNREQTLHAMGLGPLWKLRAAPVSKPELAVLDAPPLLRPVGAGQVVDWLFIQDGPVSADAEKLLDAMLAAIDLKRGATVRVIVCPSTGVEHADLAAFELALQALQPRLVVVLGVQAAKVLLGKDLEPARGQVFDRGGTPCIVSYAPTFLLENRLKKAEAWVDLCFMRREARKVLTQQAVFLLK